MFQLLQVQSDMEILIILLLNINNFSTKKLQVRSVTVGNCSVFLPEEDRVISVQPEHLAPVTPVMGDKTKVGS